jgi:O-antigen/teichoic acid export membrane protein
MRPQPEGMASQVTGGAVRAHQWFLRAVNSRLGRDTVGSVGLEIASAGLSFLSTVLLARLLEPAGYGVYAYVYAWVHVLSVLTQLGLSTLVVRETARGMAQDRPDLVQGIWRWAGHITGLLSVALAGIGATLAWTLPGSSGDDRLNTLAWAIWLVPLMALGNLRGAALQGLQRVVAGQVPEFLIRPGVLVLFLGVAAGLLDRPLSAAETMAFNVVAAALAFGFGAWMLWRATPASVRVARPQYEARAWWRSALPLAFIDGMNLINHQASTLILGFFVPDAEIGIYRVAAQISVSASFGLQAVNLVVAPHFTALYAKGDRARLQRLVTASARVIGAINVGITLAYVLLGRLFLELIFGPAYLGAYTPLLILLVGQAVNSATGSVGMLLNMTWHERDTAKGLAVSAILNVALNLLLVPLLGIVGAAVATAGALITWNVLLWRAVRRRLGIDSLAFPIGATAK